MKSLKAIILTLSASLFSGCGSDQSVLILAAGQSNMANWNSFEKAGVRAFEKTAADLGYRDVVVKNGAFSGASLSPGTLSWSDRGEGSLFNNLVELAYQKPYAIIWNQGEADAVFEITSQDYEYYLRKFFDDLRYEVGNVPIYINLVHYRIGYPKEGTDAIRAAQLRVIESDPGVFFSLDMEGRPLRDTIHLTEEGYRQVGKETAIAIFKGE